MARPRKHRINPGDRFKRVVAIEEDRSKPSRYILWRCRCDCGKEFTVLQDNLRTGNTTSCGCTRAEIGISNLKKVKRYSQEFHGLSKIPEYRVWEAMKRRCLNPADRHYDRYGGRGIQVCERWKNSFSNFLADMGQRPSPTHSIDRTNNDGNYEPSNCRWATSTEQNNNKARRTHCRRGHELAGANIWHYFDGSGREFRVCKACRRIWEDSRKHG